MGLTPHAERNRAFWQAEAPRYAAPGRRNWEQDEITWGIWRIPESELNVLPEPGGRDVVELGCGTAYWSAWLARRGARPVGVDVAPAQLEQARAFQAEFGVDFALVEASAEDVPLPDAGFDLAFSEYGASIWCDPELWIAEAARLLRPGGELVFLAYGWLLALCDDAEDAPAGPALVRDSFGLRSIEWPDGSVEFVQSHGARIRTLRRHGFELLDLVELQAPAGATTRFEYVTADWAHRWPSEEIWRARRIA